MDLRSDAYRAPAIRCRSAACPYPRKVWMLASTAARMLTTPTAIRADLLAPCVTAAKALVPTSVVKTTTGIPNTRLSAR
jgi:hypothetical protein